MKVLANDGISEIGIKTLEAKKFEIITSKIEQEKLIDFIG